MSKELFRLSGYYCGVVTTTLGTEEVIDKTRQQWIKEGRTCWVNRLHQPSNQEFLGDE